MKRIYKNRYGDEFTFTLQDDGNVLWEGNFEYCRIGYPNDYTEAYKAFHNDFPETEMLSFDDFKSIVHKYDEDLGKYVYDKYVRMVKSLTDEIDMVDPSGGCYLSRGMTLDFLGFVGVKLKDFKSVDTGFLIITEEPKQIKCYCRHTTTCDCEPLEEYENISTIEKMKPLQKQWQKNMDKTLKECKQNKEKIEQDFIECVSKSQAIYQPKQETLEETYQVFLQNKYNNPHLTDNKLHLPSFEFGAKWQSERMYSEEEVMEMFHNLSMHLPLHYEFLVKEQFKKK